MKKVKMNKKKFISRIFMVLIFFIILILCVKGILEKDKNSNRNITLIINNQEVTSELKNDIYIDKNGVLYMSEADIKSFFDKDLFYEEGSNKIITTYGTKVAAIDLNTNTMELNSASLNLTVGIIKNEKNIFLPISELKNIYNIEVKTNEKSALIFSLYKALVTVNTTKNVSLKLSESIFSKTIQKLSKGQNVIFIENAEKSGWIKVLTYEGNIGYLKEKDVGEKIQVRIDMEDSDFSSKNVDINNSIEINKKTLTQDGLKDFSSRKIIVQDIISKILSKEKFTVNLNLDNIEVSKQILERFIIELIPRLKEIGGKVVVSNNNVLDTEFIKEKNI